MNKSTRGEKIFSFFNYIILILFGLTALYPLVYTLAMSFSTAAEASRAGLHLYPREVSVLAYKMVLKNAELWRAYLVTVGRTIVGTIAAVLVSSMYGYAISRPNLKGKKFFTIFLMFTMLFNGGTIPTYLVIKNIGLLDSFWVYILPNLIGAYNVIILKNYFQGLPSSLLEAVKIDGGNDFTAFFRVVLPISKPVLATVALWVAVFHWNHWMDGLLYINDDTKQIVQIFLQRIIQASNTESMTSNAINPDLTEFTTDTIKSATIIVTVLPILCVYPFIQKYFVKGITLGAVKG